MSETTPILSVQNVVKQYAGHRALDDVSFEIPEGSIFGLLGPNGAGKTTLIRIINQITMPDEGQIQLSGEPLQPQHIANIGYLPEERGLYKKMKVGEQALYLAQLKGMSKGDAIGKLKHWFAKFEIQAWWDKKVEELSKGMAQKVQFIVTVLHQPKLLILDEPFSGFDPVNTELIKSEIMELREAGSTIIFSTHNMASVEEICDRIVLINQSRKILEGSVSEVKNRFKENIYLLEFKGQMMTFTNSLWTTAELLHHDEIAPEIHKVKLKLKEEDPTEMLQSILSSVQVRGFQEILPSMNEIFIRQVTQIKESKI